MGDLMSKELCPASVRVLCEICGEPLVVTELPGNTVELDEAFFPDIQTLAKAVWQHHVAERHGEDPSVLYEQQN
jgi:hypothetical protein